MKFLQIGFVSLLLVGVAIGIYLLSKPAIFQPKANISNGIDLDITYISQSPNYYRYCVVTNNNIPTLCPGTENQKRYPEPGENITYTAHIINKGVQPSGSFNYQWLIDDQIASESAFLGSLGPGEEFTTQLSTNWTAAPRKIAFQIDPPSGQDVFPQNNQLSFGTRDQTISYWVEKEIYDLFNNQTNLVGTNSFEDWIQAHITKMNERFSQAIYPATSPTGINDRIRIDKIVIADQLDITPQCPTGPMAQDPDLYLIDGRWQTTDGTCDNSAGRNGSYQSYVNKYINQIDWGLIHELTHQMGVIDLYRMNVKNNDINSLNGGIRVTNINGEIVPYADLDLPVFKQPGLMGGGETAPYNDGTMYESHTAGGMNSNFQKRRGFFGDYLFDTPQSNSIKIVDSFNNPIPNAQVSLYQKDIANEDIDNVPEFTGVTDSQGILPLPNRQVVEVTTATGHTLKANPFGQINMIGTNGLMLLKVTKDDKEGYGMYRLHDLNLDFYRGNALNSIVPVTTNYPKIRIKTAIENQPTLKTIALDTFHRPDSNTSMGNTETNQPWIAPVNLWGIKNNQAYAVNSSCQNQSFSLVDTGLYNGVYEIKMGQNVESSRAVFRYQDAGNYYWIENNDSFYALYKKMNNSIRLINFIYATPQNGDTIVFTLKDSDIEIKINGEIKYQGVDLTFIKGTKYGIGAWCIPGATFEKFVFSSATYPDTSINLSTDDDKDGFNNGFEILMGTNASKACAANKDDNSWPPDVTNDGFINGADVSKLVPYISGVKSYVKRYDVNLDGVINKEDGVPIAKYFLQECTAIDPVATPNPSVEAMFNIPLAADLNGNRSVEIFDFNKLVSQFGNAGSGIISDINKDEIVNIFDFNILVQNFGRTY